MIDFVKIVLRNRTLINDVWENDNLIFHSDQVRRVKDEIRNYRKKSFSGLIFTLYEDKLEITGSLHKYFNNGIHNTNDFSFVDCIRIIYELESVFGLNLNECQVVNLEFGLNIIPMESVENVVVWLKFHERNEFRYYPDLQYAKQAGRFRDGRTNTYKVLKAYAKGKQPFDNITYGDTNTFRLEVRSKQSKYINRLGVFTLNDLINSSIYKRLGTELLKEWNNVIILDKNLYGNNDKFDKYLSQDFWENCLNGDRNKLSRQRKKYFALLKKYPENVHNQVTKLLKEKLEIFGNELKNGAISTPPESKINNKNGAISTRPDSIISNKNGAISIRPVLTSKNKNDAHSAIVKVESALTNRICTETGLPIPDVQEPYTTNLTETGVKWYYENEPEIFKEKLETIIAEKWKKVNRDKPKKIWIKKIYHQIRNKISNPRNNLQKSYNNIERKGLKLFPLEETIPPTKMKIINERKK